jgi:hypothetical protein
LPGSYGALSRGTLSDGTLALRDPVTGTLPGQESQGLCHRDLVTCFSSRGLLVSRTFARCHHKEVFNETSTRRTFSEKLATGLCQTASPRPCQMDLAGTLCHRVTGPCATRSEVARTSARAPRQSDLGKVTPRGRIHRDVDSETLADGTLSSGIFL